MTAESGPSTEVLTPHCLTSLISFDLEIEFSRGKTDMISTQSSITRDLVQRDILLASISGFSRRGMKLSVRQ